MAMYPFFFHFLCCCVVDIIYSFPIKENFELSLPNHLYNILIYLSLPGTLRKESDDADRLAYTIILLFKYLN